MENGTVAKLYSERGFGFVRDAYGAEHFFNARQCVTAFDSLSIGDPVRFDLGSGRDGRKCAISVSKQAC
jgi:cold shock CspA family protein